MEINGETFKLQDMIESDIGTDFTDYGDLQDVTDIHALTALTTVDSMDTLDSNFLQNSQLYGIDVDIGGGLLVNPQTGVPIGLIQPHNISTSTVTLSVISPPISTSSAMVITQPTTVQITHIVTPHSASEALLSNANIRRHVDSQQLNITVPVPTSPSPKGTKTTCIQALPQLVIQNQKTATENNVSGLKLKQKGKNTNSNNKNIVRLNNGQIFPDKLYPKPAYSYSCLIAMALKNSQNGSLPVNEIYNFMIENFPYFKTAPNGWKNSVRHNLSLNKCFEKVEQPIGNGSQRKGCLWAMNPAKVVKMDEELQKWSNKDPIAIRRSMANPEQLSLLEKGHLKKILMDQKTSNSDNEEKTDEKKKNDNNIQNIIADTIKVEPPTTGMPTLDSSMNLDPTLHDIDLQKGIWEELYDDRLQFLNDTLSSTSTNIEVDCEEQIASSHINDLPFSHGNYYSQAAKEKKNSLKINHQVLLHPSARNKNSFEEKCSL